MAGESTLPKQFKELFKPLGVARAPKTVGNPSKGYPKYLKAYEKAFDVLAPEPAERLIKSSTHNVGKTTVKFSVWPGGEEDSGVETGFEIPGEVGIHSRGRQLEVSGLVGVKGFKHPLRFSVDLLGATIEKAGGDVVNRSQISYGLVLPDNEEVQALGLRDAGSVTVPETSRPGRASRYVHPEEQATLQQAFTIATRALEGLAA